MISKTFRYATRPTFSKRQSQDIYTRNIVIPSDNSTLEALNRSENVYLFLAKRCNSYLGMAFSKKWSLRPQRAQLCYNGAHVLILNVLGNKVVRLVSGMIFARPTAVASSFLVCIYSLCIYIFFGGGGDGLYFTAACWLVDDGGANMFGKMPTVIAPIYILLIIVARKNKITTWLLASPYNNATYTNQNSHV